MVRCAPAWCSTPAAGCSSRCCSPFRLFAGGPLGRRPAVDALDLAWPTGSARSRSCSTATTRRPVNVVGPAPVRNAEFTRALARALHRPAPWPIPRFALRIVLGEFADEAVASQRVLPAVLTASGTPSTTRPSTPPCMRPSANLRTLVRHYQRPDARVSRALRAVSDAGGVQNSLLVRAEGASEEVGGGDTEHEGGADQPGHRDRHLAEPRLLRRISEGSANTRRGQPRHDTHQNRAEAAASSTTLATIAIHQPYECPLWTKSRTKPLAASVAMSPITRHRLPAPSSR